MATKKDRTPDDLLGSLLAGKKPAPAGQPDRKPGDELQPFSGEPEKAKATYYLDTRLLASLDEVWLKLRKATGARVSKSEIVELALQMAIEQTDELARRLKKKQ